MPLIVLLKKIDAPLVWSSTCTHAFNTLKKFRDNSNCNSSGLRENLHIYVDASNMAIGLVSSQKDEKLYNRQIYFASLG